MDDATKDLPTYEILASAFVMQHAHLFGDVLAGVHQPEDGLPRAAVERTDPEGTELARMIELADVKLVLDPHQLCFSLEVLESMHDSMIQWRADIAAVAKQN